MEDNEQFILVVIQNEEGLIYNFTRPVRDNWTCSIKFYHNQGLEMVKDWVKVGFEVKAIVLIDRNPLFYISRIL